MVLATSACLDAGPFCDATCAASRNGHRVNVRTVHPSDGCSDESCCNYCGTPDAIVEAEMESIRANEAESAEYVTARN